MKTLHRHLLVLASLVSLGTGARADDISVPGIARAASLFLSVGSVCPRFQRVDADLAGRYAKAEAAVGERAIGQRRFGGLMADEMQRRGREIGETGARAWCADQKARLGGMGLGALYR